VTLLTFAVDHCAALVPLLLGTSQPANQYLLPSGPTAANLPHAAAAVDNWDRQTDGHRIIT